VGYADGYKRLFSNRAQVLIRGQRAPVVGAVCMDLCMVDITDIAGVDVSDEVVLMGQQQADAIGADEMGVWADSFNYEMLCSVGSRVPRRYIGAGHT
jgi:alanine racemase